MSYPLETLQGLNIEANVIHQKHLHHTVEDFNVGDYLVGEVFYPYSNGAIFGGQTTSSWQYTPSAEKVIEKSKENNGDTYLKTIVNEIKNGELAPVINYHFKEREHYYPGDRLPLYKYDPIEHELISKQKHIYGNHKIRRPSIHFVEFGKDYRHRQKIRNKDNASVALDYGEVIEKKYPGRQSRALPQDIVKFVIDEFL